jgi:hypothetical protein
MHTSQACAGNALRADALPCACRSSAKDSTWPLCSAAGPMLLGSGSNDSTLPQVLPEDKVFPGFKAAGSPSVSLHRGPCGR